mmetsp:Transcript_14881/g.30968  ORF Transcript_14881/g.30968 Transcript_14881/m.30968 type:complete len:294 (+) Transcript_14881:39-920(+)
MALGSHASILSISALASLLPGVAGDVSCGGHMALLCSRCVESQPAEDAASFCNGDCRWTGEKCVLRGDRLINCGGHRAKSCARCPDGHGGGWCHGDCMWLSEKCVVATVKNQAAAHKEDKKVQSHPHFRPGGSWLSWLVGVRSEPEPSPETLYTGFVRNLVGTTISRTVQDTGKDVLVNCYAPWCGHCQNFKPQYKELARRLSHVSTVVIAQMDCTRNDLGPLWGSVSGFPTIALFPSGDTSGMIEFYVGSRKPDDMIRWLHTKARTSFSDTPPEGEMNDDSDEGLLPRAADL